MTKHLLKDQVTFHTLESTRKAGKQVDKILIIYAGEEF